MKPDAPTQEEFQKLADAIAAFAESGGDQDAFDDAAWDAEYALYRFDTASCLYDLQNSANSGNEKLGAQTNDAQNQYDTANDAYWTAMEDVYERPFEVVSCSEAELPAEREASVPVGGHMEGCRIGFDAGGSDRKVSAVVDGTTVYSEEVVWHPKTSADPQYQYDGIVSAFKTAASKMPRVDAIGVSSAGVFIGNSPMVSSLFIKVPRSRREEVKTIYDRAAKEVGDVPIVVANDGDVTALAGAMQIYSGRGMRPAGHRLSARAERR